MKTCRASCAAVGAEGWNVALCLACAQDRKWRGDYWLPRGLLMGKEDGECLEAQS